MEAAREAVRGHAAAAEEGAAAAPFMTIFSTHDEQFFKRKDVEAYHAKVGSDLIGEANEELVVWETDADGGKCGHLVPFENPKEFVACVVRNIAKAKTDNV